MITEEVDKAHKIGNYRLRTLGFDKAYYVVIGNRAVLNEDFTYNTYTWFFNFQSRQDIKILYDFSAYFFEFSNAESSGSKGI